MTAVGSTPFPIEEIAKNVKYFAITIGANDDGNWWTETPTWFTGFVDDERRIEKRAMRPVDPERMGEFWKISGQPFFVVNNDRGYVRWMLGGGHALITEDQVRKNLPWAMEASSSVREGLFGWIDPDKLPKTAFQKAPTPKVRAAVLKRDKYRCMLCGQRPADDVNVQLDLHHIRPREKGGVTTEKNLISICHTCHVGLEPHFDCNLFDLIETKPGDSEDNRKYIKLQEYLKAVQNYRKSLGAFISPS